MLSETCSYIIKKLSISYFKRFERVQRSETRHLGMRESIKQFVKICSETLPIWEPIYEFGALQVEGQEEFADLRPIFPGKEYIGADLRNGPGVDVILDLHDINLPAESVGTVLILDTLEHVEYPRRAIEDAYRTLKGDGILIISSVMNFGIHDYPQDYWRFTPEAFRSLLKQFSYSFVDSLGNPEFPHTILGIGFKSLGHRDLISEFLRQYESWKQVTMQKDSEPPIWKRLAKSLIPPILLTIYRKLYSEKASAI
jgi:SAM-dependent methyltransferase